MPLSPETIRQSVLAFLERSPKSEWVNGGDIGNMILGRPYENNDFYIVGRNEDGSRIHGPRTMIQLELNKMEKEGLIERKPHAGWRIKQDQEKNLIEDFLFWLTDLQQVYLCKVEDTYHLDYYTYRESEADIVSRFLDYKRKNVSD